MTDFDARHVQIRIDDKIVLMRKEDCLLNATQILALTNMNSNDSERLLQRMEQSIKVEIVPPLKDVPNSGSWVSFEHARLICNHFRLEQELQPLIDYGLKLQRDDDSKHISNYPTGV